jgi:hypothetical protein
MKSANASKLDRKSGVRWSEPGAPVDSLPRCYDTDSAGTGEDVMSLFSRPGNAGTEWPNPEHLPLSGHLGSGARYNSQT